MASAAVGKTFEQGGGHLCIHCPADVCVLTLRGTEDGGHSLKLRLVVMTMLVRS
jgi:hypothetical protein